MIVFVFVFFNSCCMNLNYDWNSLLKKSFSFFFNIYKPDLIFLLLKKIFFIISKQIWSFINPKTFFFFLVLKKQIWYFSNQKTLFYVIKTYLNFYLQKPLFSIYCKTNMVFWQIKINFFTNQNRSDFFFFNKRRDFIHR